jgi:hypothetical protein
VFQMVEVSRNASCFADTIENVILGKVQQSCNVSRFPVSYL